MHIEVKPYSIITCLNEFIQLYSCAYCIGPKSKNFKLFYYSMHAKEIKHWQTCVCCVHVGLINKKNDLDLPYYWLSGKTNKHFIFFFKILFCFFCLISVKIWPWEMTQTFNPNTCCAIYIYLIWQNYQCTWYCKVDDNILWPQMSNSQADTVVRIGLQYLLLVIQGD